MVPEFAVTGYFAKAVTVSLKISLGVVCVVLNQVYPEIALERIMPARMICSGLSHSMFSYVVSHFA